MLATSRALVHEHREILAVLTSSAFFLAGFLAVLLIG